MSVIDVLKRGVAFANTDEAAKEMLADFKDHKVGMSFDGTELTVVIRDGAVSLEPGMRPDCHAAMQMKTVDLCGAIDNSYDLMEIREKGVIIKGDAKDPNTAVHFMALFPFFDGMVRLYGEDPEFQKLVDACRSS
jgi:hypothetical protein